MVIASPIRNPFTLTGTSANTVENIDNIPLPKNARSLLLSVVDSNACGFACQYCYSIETNFEIEEPKNQIEVQEVKRYCKYCRRELINKEIDDYHLFCKQEMDGFNAKSD